MTGILQTPESNRCEWQKGQQAIDRVGHTKLYVIENIRIKIIGQIKLLIDPISEKTKD